MQQFIVDANTLDYPVGSIYYSITCETLDGIDAKAVNEHLLSRNRPQRIRILYTDGAGESASHNLEEFFTDVNIQHLQSVPESQHQNGLAEHGGGLRLVNMVRHDLDMSGGQLPQHWRLHLLLGRRSLFMEGQTQQHCALKF